MMSAFTLSSLESSSSSSYWNFEGVACLSFGVSSISFFRQKVRRWPEPSSVLLCCLNVILGCFSSSEVEGSLVPFCILKVNP